MFFRVDDAMMIIIITLLLYSYTRGVQDDEHIAVDSGSCRIQDGAGEEVVYVYHVMYFHPRVDDGSHDNIILLFTS